MVEDAFDRWDSVVEETVAWAKDLRLQRASGSAFHKLMSAWKDKSLLMPPDTEPEVYIEHNSKLLDYEFQLFAVEHDWASAFQDAEDFRSADDPWDFRLPYPHCCFEFQISGKRVCFVTHFDGENYRLAAFAQTRDSWIQPPLKDHRFENLSKLLKEQIRAIGVALDAEVCRTELVRAPHKLNRAREKRGELPVFDFHVVKLAERTRATLLPESSQGESLKKSPRLHFRRGHWRHFEVHKTWIRWTLVGNPDLGFIDKRYRL